MRHHIDGYYIVLIFSLALRLMLPLFKRACDVFDRIFKSGKYNPHRD